MSVLHGTAYLAARCQSIKTGEINK